MKKIFFLLTSVLIITSMYAQESKVAIGIQVTPSISSIRGNTMIDDYDSRLVVSPGVTIDYFISENLTFNTGLLFERKGGKSAINFIDEDGVLIGNPEIKANFDYLSMPLMLTYSTNGKINFYFGGGTYIGFLLSQKNILSSIENAPAQIEDNSENFKKMDIGISFIAGLKIPFSKKLILDLGLRDHYGLINTSKLDIVNNGSIKTNSFGLQIGLKLRL